MDNQSRYIWQQPDWPCWRHDLPVLFPLLIEVSQAQGRLLGRLQDLGAAQRAEASLGVLTEDVLKTSEIEGESLDVRSVRSSLARRLGVDVGAVAPVDRHVEGRACIFRHRRPPRCLSRWRLFWPGPMRQAWEHRPMSRSTVLVPKHC